MWLSLTRITLAGAVMRFAALRYPLTVTFDGTEYVRFADALVVLACVAWYRATLGQWTLTPKVAELHEAAGDWRTVEPRLGAPVVADAPLATRLLAGVRAWPANAWTQAQALLWSWPWPLLLLSLWGLARRRGLETAALVYLPLLPLLGLSQQGRFALAAVPALAIAASLPLVTERVVWRRAAAVALAVFGAAACAWALADAFRTPFNGGQMTDRRGRVARARRTAGRRDHRPQAVCGFLRRAPASRAGRRHVRSAARRDGDQRRELAGARGVPRSGCRALSAQPCVVVAGRRAEIAAQTRSASSSGPSAASSTTKRAGSARANSR